MDYGINAKYTKLPELDRDENFGIRDEKGRTCGSKIRYSERTYHVAEGCASWAGFHETAEAAEIARDKIQREQGFQAETHATRDGYNYGASQRCITAATLAECQKKAEARMNGARKRYAKKYADK